MSINLLTSIKSTQIWLAGDLADMHPRPVESDIKSIISNIISWYSVTHIWNQYGNVMNMWFLLHGEIQILKMPQKAALNENHCVLKLGLSIFIDNINASMVLCAIIQEMKLLIRYWLL